ncbi:MAG TPA: RNA-binding S4 domain-containing protein [Acidimicrobiales bacterium]|nr:RNA-binding S4 domain-containing protein [Acidimicrobiales bacterium]
MDTTRLDRWLWAVRVCKTRSAATEVCRGGHVHVNGVAAKAATRVRVDDRVEARVAGRIRIVEVTRLIDKRVGAAVAQECYVDHSPPPPERGPAPVFTRDPGAGRPTKRDRRALDRLRGRNR